MKHRLRVLATQYLSITEQTWFSENNLDLLITPLIAIHFIPFELKQENEADILLFTSQNAVNSVLQNPQVDSLRHYPVICVGRKTRQLLIRHGWRVILFADSAQQLIAELSIIEPQQKWLFFCGNKRSDLLPNYFKQHQIRCQQIEVYQTELRPQKIKQHFDAVLFFSPSAVESFKQVNELTHQSVFCIGQTTATMLQNYRKLFIADYPSKKATIMLCINQLRRPPYD